MNETHQVIMDLVQRLLEEGLKPILLEAWEQRPNPDPDTHPSTGDAYRWMDVLPIVYSKIQRQTSQEEGLQVKMAWGHWYLYKLAVEEYGHPVHYEDPHRRSTIPHFGANWTFWLTLALAQLYRLRDFGPLDICVSEDGCLCYGVHPIVEHPDAEAIRDGKTLSASFTIGEEPDHNLCGA